MIPPPANWGAIQSNAERRVADLLTQVDLDEAATCLYSLHLPRHAYKRMSEIDFVIVTPSVLLVVEVKGGRISRRDGIWGFTDRYGVVHQKREGPFEQARSAMFALRDLMAERRPRLDIAMGYLVVTPDQDLGDDLEWEREQHAGPRQMTVTGLQDALKAAVRHWARPVRSSKTAYQEALSLLRPDFDLVPSLATRVARLESHYVKLAERQYELIAGAERNPRLLCLGGAGSGKTLLAVETASRAAATGDAVLLTCRSPGLARLLQKTLSHTTVVVRAFDECDQTAPADVLVVDEAQDLMDVESYVRLDSLVKGGLDNGVWRIFCDPNNQAAVDGVFDPAILDELQRRATLVDLPYNCRNTVQVVQQTQLLTGADLGVARAGEGPPVEFFQCETEEDVAARLDAHLKRLRREEVTLETVAVVTLFEKPADSAATRTRAFRQGSLVRYDGDPTHATTGQARLMTAREIKGLEASHVCIVDVQQVTGDAAAKLYVAMTRPTISLWIALSPLAWRQLSEASDQGVE